MNSFLVLYINSPNWIEAYDCIEFNFFEKDNIFLCLINQYKHAFEFPIIRRGKKSICIKLESLKSMRIYSFCVKYMVGLTLPVRKGWRKLLL